VFPSKNVPAGTLREQFVKMLFDFSRRFEGIDIDVEEKAEEEDEEIRSRA